MTWTWWMTLLAIFAALVLIGGIPVGVDARYNAEGVFLAAKLGPIRLQLLPQKQKKKKTYDCNYFDRFLFCGLYFIFKTCRGARIENGFGRSDTRSCRYCR